MRTCFVLSIRAMLAGLLLLAGPVAPTQAAKLWQILEAAQKDCAGVAQALKTATAEVDAEVGCADAITRLYLKSLKDHEQQQILQTAIKNQRTALEVAQRMAESGRLSLAGILVAEIELKRLQILEAKRVTARRHSRLVFESVLATDPAKFVPPVIPADAWPEDEAAALSALVSDKRDSAEMRRHLKHAWVDYQGAQRRRSLLRPMTALTQDLAKIAEEQFNIGQVTIIRLSEHMNDAVQQSLALAEAENDLLAARLRILAILGRMDSIE